MAKSKKQPKSMPQTNKPAAVDKENPAGELSPDDLKKVTGGAMVDYKPAH